MQKISKPIIIIAIIVLIGVSAYIYLRDKSAQTGGEAFTTENGEVQVAENEALVVENQKAGTSMTVKQAELPAPGFVVIYRDAGNRPGGIVAQSKLLEKGTHKDIEIKTEVYPIEKGKQYYMMINLDDGDKIFNAGKDLPTVNKTGGSYMVTFQAL